MATNIFKKEKQLSHKAVKAEIKRIRGWSETRYKKELKTIARGLSRYKTQFEGDATLKSPTQFLYTEAKARERYGLNYQPTQYVQDVRKLSRVAKSKTILSTRRQVQNIKDISVKSRFSGLIQSNAKASEIASKIKDPFKREKALADYANKLHTKIDTVERVQQAQAIPFSSQVYGSDSTIDFDIDKYL